MTAVSPIRTGQDDGKLPREEFRVRFMNHYRDPAYNGEREAIVRLEAIAWDAFEQGRKAPLTRPGGAGYADPDYELSVEWLDTRARLEDAERRQKDDGARSRVLVIVGSARNDGSCPGEMSKSWRLAQWVRETVEAGGAEADVLDLSLVTSEYGRAIHPCKGCVATAMPLCHWPCSCYPNHAAGQVNDWMAEIYERWVSAHGIVIVAPTYWYQSPTPLKAMMDRLVCADGGNPDPSRTHGKKAAEAKAIEAQGWDYPQHLAGRCYGLIVHGDVAGIEAHRRNLSDWLDWMGLIEAGAQARLDRYIGYFEPYQDSHDTLDRDRDVQEEARNVARAVLRAVSEVRAGRLRRPDHGLRKPRPK